jgi:hypothetical protein
LDSGVWTQGLQPWFFFEIGSHKLFARAGFEMQFSRSLPPE